MYRCVDMHVWVCAHVCTGVCISMHRLCTCMYRCVQSTHRLRTCVCTHICTCVRAHVCACVHIHVQVCACMYRCVHMCVQVCVHLCTGVCTCVQEPVEPRGTGSLGAGVTGCGEPTRTKPRSSVRAASALNPSHLSSPQSWVPPASASWALELLLNSEEG